MGIEVERVIFDKIFNEARSVMNSAYAPYSNFFVGAAIITETNDVFVGCNVENAAYPEGTCAEAGAISAMVAGGSKLISAMCIVANSKKLITPCGGCRQKIAEFSSSKTLVFMANTTGTFNSCSIQDLLPGYFSKNFFKN